MVVGTILEERDLMAAFGETCRDDQQRVAMLVPWRILPAQEPQRSENGRP